MNVESVHGTIHVAVGESSEGVLVRLTVNPGDDQISISFPIHSLFNRLHTLGDTKAFSFQLGSDQGLVIEPSVMQDILTYSAMMADTIDSRWHESLSIHGTEMLMALHRRNCHEVISTLHESLSVDQLEHEHQVLCLAHSLVHQDFPVVGRQAASIICRYFDADQDHLIRSFNGSDSTYFIQHETRCRSLLHDQLAEARRQEEVFYQQLFEESPFRLPDRPLRIVRTIAV
jgi:hypothetical protein